MLLRLQLRLLLLHSCLLLLKLALRSLDLGLFLASFGFAVLFH
jgi:hypothetical protein